MIIKKKKIKKSMGSIIRLEQAGELRTRIATGYFPKSILL